MEPADQVSKAAKHEAIYMYIVHNTYYIILYSEIYYINIKDIISGGPGEQQSMRLYICI